MLADPLAGTPLRSFAMLRTSPQRLHTIPTACAFVVRIIDSPFSFTNVIVSDDVSKEIHWNSWAIASHAEAELFMIPTK